MTDLIITAETILIRQNMENWIEHLNNPLVLIGFMAFIFAGFIKLLLKNNIIKFNQANSVKLINKSLNLVFVLALVGMVSGFLSQKEVLQSIDNPENKVAKSPTSIKQGGIVNLR